MGRLSVSVILSHRSEQVRLSRDSHLDKAPALQNFTFSMAEGQTL
jgi:hypothetical protein